LGGLRLGEDERGSNGQGGFVTRPGSGEWRQSVALVGGVAHMSDLQATGWEGTRTKAAALAKVRIVTTRLRRSSRLDFGLSGQMGPRRQG
jgi:hypothetical protein